MVRMFFRSWHTNRWRVRLTGVLIGLLFALPLVFFTAGGEEQADDDGQVSSDSVFVVSADGDHIILQNGEVWEQTFSPSWHGYPVGEWKRATEPLPFAPDRIRSFCFSPGQPWTITDADHCVWWLVNVCWQVRPIEEPNGRFSRATRE